MRTAAYWFLLPTVGFFTHTRTRLPYLIILPFAFPFTSSGLFVPYRFHSNCIGSFRLPRFRALSLLRAPCRTCWFPRTPDGDFACIPSPVCVLTTYAAHTAVATARTTLRCANVPALRYCYPFHCLRATTHFLPVETTLERYMPFFTRILIPLSLLSLLLFCMDLVFYSPRASYSHYDEDIYCLHAASMDRWDIPATPLPPHLPRTTHPCLPLYWHKLPACPMYSPHTPLSLYPTPISSDSVLHIPRVY